MKFVGHMVALGAVVFVGASLLNGDRALASGQHWRPAPAYATMPGRPYAGIANVPSFRPTTVAQAHRPGYPTRAEPVVQRPLRPHLPVYPARYGMPHLARPHPLPPPPTLPVWGAPFGNAVSAWQPAAPRFIPQFAQRSAEARWSQPRPRQFSRPFDPRVAARHGERVSHWPARGGWRPASVAWRDHGVARLAVQGPAFRSTALPFGAGPPAHRGGVDLAHGALVDVQWRPVTASPETTGAFRPIAGDRGPGDDRMASHEPGRFGGAPAGLPGWITTHQDLDDPLACRWCNGS